MCRNIFYGLLLTATLFVAVGCSDKCKITGSVTLEDGTPVPNGNILFQGEAKQAYGTIKSDGSYFLSTNGNGDGIDAGSYRVVISGTSRIVPGKVLRDEMDTGEEPVIDVMYANAETTPLSYEVTKTEKVDFKVKPFTGYKRSR
ncbi:MAG: carboxypeptidase-like regulatory domain-containing protein [Planctomycetaceae bacterium]|jgi:hypothetical protein|nr:carboxypeptidase-like regulatory domain-containing protein [Planctomycetaceae bacterium]